MNLAYALLITLLSIVVALVGLRKLDNINLTKLSPMQYAVAATFLTFLPPAVFFGCLLTI